VAIGVARIVILKALPMHTAKHFATGFGVLTGLARVALGLSLGLLPSCMLDDAQGAQGADTEAGEDPSMTADDGEAVTTVSACSTGRIQCHAHVRTAGHERRIVSHAATPPAGLLGATDLQGAYGIDAKRLATTTKPTIAITDAFGYPNLEADLAVYRTQYGLPPCTVANGCLKIVNQRGLTTALPAASTDPADDWTVETALDVDMASAACPLCNILVVQADDDMSNGLDVAQNTAASLGAAVISDSWGAPEINTTAQKQLLAQSDEMFYKHPTIAIFVASGDNGYDDMISAGRPTGPGYPATSKYTISVGATRLTRDPTSTRGWKEVAWSLTLDPKTMAPDPARGAGGSACSFSIPKPAYQSASPCAFKATADIAAVGDPVSGVAVYNSNVIGNAQPKGWIGVGGTSASAPFVAGIFAATGNGSQSSGKFISDNAAKLWDVTSGNNGTCTGQTLLCNAGPGWDGPTGFGTPNVKMLMPAASDGTGSGGGSGTGSGDGSSSTGSDGGGGDGGSDGISGGCSASGGGASGASGAGLMLGLALLGARRRRRS
jgi:MYXO-CTERM domain-containing protein